MKTGRLLIGLLLLLVTAPAYAQRTPVKWTARLEPAEVRAGEAAQVVVEARIQKPWHIYSTKEYKGMGPQPTVITVEGAKTLEAAGQVVSPAPIRKHDKGFGIEVELYEPEVAFGLPVKVAEGPAGKRKALVVVEYMACKEGTCTPPLTAELPLEFTVAEGSARPDRVAAITTLPTQPPGYHPPAPAAGGPAPAAGGGSGGETVAGQIQRAQGAGLLTFLWLAVSMGFLALLTPCVFPMVPITVSFFAKQQENSGRRGIGGALAYSLGIIGTFTGLGLLVTALFGAGGVSALATNPWINIGLAVLFVVLAINLFGGFQIILPASLVEKAQSGSRRGGFVGPMLMGLTFTLTSFTCTVPFVGTLLATTTQGSALWPVAGMLAFSTAFASPFFLLALFPQWLARMPKSGSWLVTVKAYMGFLELAAAVKFLSNVDLVWTLGILTRPVFLAIWFTIAVVAACYMLGWLRLPHDAGGLGPIRRLVGVGTGVLAVFCLLAINGRSLGKMNAFLPPVPYPGQSGGAAAPGQIAWIHDYDEGVRLAKATGKPLFLNFTGVTCTNCREMESNVFPHPSVRAELDKFVAVELFTDIKNDPKSERYKKMEEEMFNTVSLPLYAVVTAHGEKVAETGYDANPARFAEFLRSAHARSEALSSGERLAQGE